MMKSVRIPLMAAAVSLLAAPGVLAGSGVLNADVPFNFVVADRHLPSGEYRVEAVGPRRSGIGPGASSHPRLAAGSSVG